MGKDAEAGRKYCMFKVKLNIMTLLEEKGLKLAHLQLPPDWRGSSKLRKKQGRQLSARKPTAFTLAAIIFMNLINVKPHVLTVSSKFLLITKSWDHQK